MTSIDPKRAKTARGRRILREMAPKLIENPRTALVLRGQKTSAVVNAALTEIFLLKKPNAKHFTRHNAVHPFEDITPLEFLCQKNDASLFAFGTHSKKRPHNLVLGRMFDHHVLDMVELGIEEYKSMHDFDDAPGGASSETKPCLLFSGAEWDHSSELQWVRGLLVDFFHGQVVEAISPLGIDHVIVFTAASGKVLLRHYVCRLMKSAEGTSPHVKLLETGPSLDLTIRRTQLANTEVLKQAMRRPKAEAAAPKKVKNITRDKLLGRQGKLHMPRQDLTQLATARMKALRGKRRSAGPEEGGGPADGAGADRPRKKQRKAAEE